MTLNNLHIVIADDDEDDGMLIVKSFEINECYTKVSLVKNGQELLDYLNNKDIEIPDVILTDINMPIMDGIEALVEIMNNAHLKTIPCFVYSTAINPAYEARFRELGIKDFIIKPYSLEEFDDIPTKIISTLA